MKLPAGDAALPLGSRVALGDTVETRGTLFRLVAGGTKAVVASHVAPLDAPPEPDYVAVAERFLECALSLGRADQHRPRLLRRWCSCP